MSTRRIAYMALYDVTEKGAYANLRLKKAQEGLEKQDARFVSALVYTTLDNLIYIDYIISQHATGKLDAPIRCVLRLGVCQAMLMNVPVSAACNESVKLAKEIGKAALSGYVNAVMRNVCRNMNMPVTLPENRRERICVLYSYPKYIVDEYCDRFGEEFTEELLKQSLHSFTLRVAPPYTVEELEAALSARGISVSRGEMVKNSVKLDKGFELTKDPLFLNGSITAQSESSMLVCTLVEPKPGMKILDACAAPGGKTAYMATLADNKADITAWELHEHRTALIEKTLERMKVSGVKVETRDASINTPELRGQFDAVLIDAPCSGLGVPGKPDARYVKTDALIEELAFTQSKLLDACAPYVKCGGTLVYSTCTISYRENEKQIEAFLKRHEEFSPCDIKGCLPEGSNARERANNGMVQLFPHLDKTEGFFMAKLKKRGL